jgi:hypothetical protein
MFCNMRVFRCFLQTLAVLNPFRTTDASILQDSDLAGPLVFCLAFGAFLLLVSSDAGAAVNGNDRGYLQ